MRDAKVGTLTRGYATFNVGYALLNLGQQDAKAGQALFDKFPKRYQDLLVQRNTDVHLRSLADESLHGAVLMGSPLQATKNNGMKVSAILRIRAPGWWSPSGMVETPRLQGAAMLAAVPAGESPAGGDAQMPPLSYPAT